jgi:hypothetical protein
MHPLVLVGALALFVGPADASVTKKADLGISSYINSSCTIRTSTVALANHALLVTNLLPSARGSFILATRCNGDHSLRVTLDANASSPRAEINAHVRPVLTAAAGSAPLQVPPGNSVKPVVAARQSISDGGVIQNFAISLAGQDLAAGSYVDTLVAIVSF